MSYVAECEACGVIERGDLEQVGDAVEDHEQFHDVQVKRVATDGGVDNAGDACLERSIDLAGKLLSTLGASGGFREIAVHGWGSFPRPKYGPFDIDCDIFRAMRTVHFLCHTPRVTVYSFSSSGRDDRVGVCLECSVDLESDSENSSGNGGGR